MTKTTKRAMRLAATGLACTIVATVPAVAADFFAGTDPGLPTAEGDPAVLPEGAKLMQVFDDGCVLTEGVAAGPDGFMYFSDITFTASCKDESGKYLQAGNIFKYDPGPARRPCFAARRACRTG